MNQTIKNLAYVLAVLATLWVWGNCRESAGASKQRLRDSTVAWNTHSHATDLRVSRLAAESLELGARLMRLQRNDSVARTHSAVLKTRTIVPDSGTPREVLITQLAIKDSIIAAQDSVIAASDSGLTIWRALAVERGELLQRALQERDGYRNIASAWQRKAEPGALTKLGRALPYIAAGFVLAKVLR